MRHTLGSCSEEHPDTSVDFTVFYDACETLSMSLENCEARGKAKRKKKLHEAVNTHCDYVKPSDMHPASSSLLPVCPQEPEAGGMCCCH